MAAGGEETRECEPWDRCWCVLEMAIRYFAETKVPLGRARPLVKCCCNRYCRMLQHTATCCSILPLGRWSMARAGAGHAVLG